MLVRKVLLISKFRCILNHGNPFVPTLYPDICRFSRCFSLQCIMISKVIVIELVSFEDRRIHFLNASHNFFSVSDFTIKTLHFVIVVIALNVYVPYMRGTRCNSAPKFLFVRFMEIHCSIAYQDVGLFTRDFFPFFEHWPSVLGDLVICDLLSNPKGVWSSMSA